MPIHPPRCLLASIVLLACGASHAAGVVIYRCTDAFGALTVQNDVPCPKGSHQTKEVIEAPAPMPAYHPRRPAPRPLQEAPAPPSPAPATGAAPVAPIADADRLPPPPLYRCNTYDNDSYLSESASPEPRCVRLQTTDVGGSGQEGAGAACQMVTDQCQRVADGAACPEWKQRLREVQSASTFAAPGNADAAKAEFERVRAIVSQSICGR